MKLRVPLCIELAVPCYQNGSATYRSTLHLAFRWILFLLHVCRAPWAMEKRNIFLCAHAREELGDRKPARDVALHGICKGARRI